MPEMLWKELSVAILCSLTDRAEKVQAIKDRWAACMQGVHKVKTLNAHAIMRYPAPNADGEPEQVLQYPGWFASAELLTSDAVFEPMQGK